MTSLVSVPAFGVNPISLSISVKTMVDCLTYDKTQQRWLVLLAGLERHQDAPLLLSSVSSICLYAPLMQQLYAMHRYRFRVAEVYRSKSG